MIGPAVAGILIATVGEGVCFLVNAASFVAVIGSLVTLDLTKLNPTPPTPRARGQLREGFRYVRRTPELAVPLLMMAAVGCLTYEFQVSLPVMASRGLHVGSTGFGFMTGAMGFGAVLGGLLVAARGKIGVRPLVVSAAGFGVTMSLAALAPSLPVELIALMFVGSASISFMSMGNSTLQLTAEPNMRGRVMSLWFVSFQGSTPIGGPIVGWLMAVAGARAGLGVGAITCFLVALAGLTALGGLPRAPRGTCAGRGQRRRPYYLSLIRAPKDRLPRPMVTATSSPDTDRMITVENVTKRYGDKVAVDDLSFEVKPGIVTGFLGPNGAGKSTTMRLILGLDAPTGGTITLDGRKYADLPAPLHEVGAMLEARAIHTGRSAYNHLLALAQTHGIGRARVKEVIDLVGIQDVARKRVGGFSLGMGQRLGVAAALLGNPGVLILDEPANGLDPEGILWIRTLLKRLAKEGRTVFLSSHLMAEMAQTADHLVVIGRGRLIADTSVADFVDRASTGAAVRVVSPQATELRDALARRDARVDSIERDVLEVHGLSGQAIGEIALAEQIVLAELTPLQLSLEQAFMRLTGESVEYHAAYTDENPNLKAAA